MVILLNPHFYLRAVYIPYLIRDRPYGVPGEYKFNRRNHFFFNDIWYNINWEILGDGKNITFEVLPGIPSDIFLV